MCEEKDMTPLLLKDLGMRFPTENSKHKRRYGLYQCPYCGEGFEAVISYIKYGSIKSCGCYQKQKTKETNSSHGLKKHRLYQTWANMRTRCYNIKYKEYKYYGGRGIQICDRWLDIKNFIEDMYPSYQEGLTLDRIDVNGNYEPDNCRWADLNTQARNTRDIISTNKSGYRGVCFHKKSRKWVASIKVKGKLISLGTFYNKLEAAKAYERYVRLNNLEHNFTPVLSEEEIEELYKP